MNWKQPKQLSKTTLPFGRSLNGPGRELVSWLVGWLVGWLVSWLVSRTRKPTNQRTNKPTNQQTRKPTNQRTK